MGNIVSDKLFCAAPWNHFFVQQDGDVRVCCMVGGEGEVLGNINESTWEDIWEGEKFQDLRKRFLEKDSETLKYCKHCTDYDKFGEGSCRHQFNSFVKNTESAVEQLVRRPRISSLDLRTSRTCGMACRICGPWNSTRWERELNFRNRNNVSEIGMQNVKQLIEDQKRNIVHVNIVGGEPFLMEEAFYLLNELQPFKKHIKILLNTNCQTLTYKGHNMLELLEGFEWVQIDASLDAVGEAAEYQRYGVPWKVVKSNFEKLITTPFKIWVHPTISIFNILRIVDLLEYLESLPNQNFELCGGNMLFEPEEYNITNLPAGLKDSLSEKLIEESRRFKREYRNLIRQWVDFMNSKESLVDFSKTVRKIEEMDLKIGKKKFLDINPEFIEFWKQ